MFLLSSNIREVLQIKFSVTRIVGPFFCYVRHHNTRAYETVSSSDTRQLAVQTRAGNGWFPPLHLTDVAPYVRHGLCKGNLV